MRPSGCTWRSRSLSVAIRQLEQELGTPLLTRTTRDVRLTDAGSAFLQGARATLAGIERTVAEARRAAAGELGRLRIAFSWGARFVTLPALGQAFRSSYPDVHLRTEEMWNSRMADALESRAADLAVSLCAEIVAGVRYEAIRSEPLIAIVTDDHPLAAETEIALAALAGEPFVMFAGVGDGEPAPGAGGGGAVSARGARGDGDHVARRARLGSSRGLPRGRAWRVRRRPRGRVATPRAYIRLV